MGALLSTGRDCVGLAILASSRGVRLRFNYRGEEDSTKGLYKELLALLPGPGSPLTQEWKEALIEIIHTIPQPAGSIFLSRGPGATPTQQFFCRPRGLCPTSRTAAHGTLPTHLPGARSTPAG